MGWERGRAGGGAGRCDIDFTEVRSIFKFLGEFCSCDTSPLILMRPLILCSVRIVALYLISETSQ